MLCLTAESIKHRLLFRGEHAHQNIFHRSGRLVRIFVSHMNVMAFDALYTNNQIQKLKVLLPYVEPSMQKNMAIYIKYEPIFQMCYKRNERKLAERITAAAKQD